MSSISTLCVFLANSVCQSFALNSNQPKRNNQAWKSYSWLKVRVAQGTQRRQHTSARPQNCRICYLNAHVRSSLRSLLQRCTLTLKKKWTSHLGGLLERLNNRVCDEDEGQASVQSAFTVSTVIDMFLFLISSFLLLWLSLWCPMNVTIFSPFLVFWLFVT